MLVESMMILLDYHFQFHIVYKMDDAKKEKNLVLKKKKKREFLTKSVFKSARSVVLFFKLN